MEGERSEVMKRYCRWRGAIADGGEQSEVEGSDSWRKEIADGGGRSQVEGSDSR